MSPLDPNKRSVESVEIWNPRWKSSQIRCQALRRRWDPGAAVGFHQPVVYTPQKSNIDTKNFGFENVSPFFKYGYVDLFWISMLVLGRFSIYCDHSMQLELSRFCKTTRGWVWPRCHQPSSKRYDTQKGLFAGSYGFAWLSLPGSPDMSCKMGGWEDEVPAFPVIEGLTVII